MVFLKFPGLLSDLEDVRTELEQIIRFVNDLQSADNEAGRAADIVEAGGGLTLADLLPYLKKDGSVNPTGDFDFDGNSIEGVDTLEVLTSLTVGGKEVATKEDVDDSLVWALAL